MTKYSFKGRRWWFVKTFSLAFNFLIIMPTSKTQKRLLRKHSEDHKSNFLHILRLLLVRNSSPITKINNNNSSSQSSGSLTRKWCRNAAFFLVWFCWLKWPLTPSPNLLLGGSLRNIVQNSVARITGSVPFLAEWEMTSRKNAEKIIFCKKMKK